MPLIQRSRFMALARLSVLVFIATLFRSPAPAQTAVPDESGRLVFKANARTVVLDVVVTGRDGKPMQGLHKQDFTVTEDGRPQAINFFEEHTGAHPLMVEQAKLPPNVFTNIPPVKPSDALTVLLLDSLNTELQDQSFVHAQMLKYLKNMQPGTRMAIFALGTHLSFIQGFTDDSTLLAAAIRDPKFGAGPQTSPLLQSRPEAAAEQQTISAMAQYDGSGAAALQQFLAEQKASQNDLRVLSTFAAFQEMAAYLAGIPGRKNIIWFSSAFPLVLFPNPNINDSFAAQRNYDQEIRKTDSMLAAAQVAIYPVAAGGLANNATYDVGNQLVGVNTAQQAQQQLSQSFQDDTKQRNAGHNAMDDMARDTGGKAFYNGNGLADAVAKVIDQGSYFYTMTYPPSNTASDGKFRKIQLKLSREASDKGATLSYRRGYYAANAKEIKAQAAKPASDPLHPFMGPGMPSSTQIPLALRVQRVATPPDATKPGDGPALQTRDQAAAGDNPSLKAPLTRYRVDFVVAASGLQLDPAPDGSHHGKIESTIVIYNREGQALNWMVRRVALDMDAARYAQVQANGVNFTLEIDVPSYVPADAGKAGISLRGGVFDLNANLAGTIELPLSSVIGIAKN